jgi:flavin-dependent dehydrogenase
LNSQVFQSDVCIIGAGPAGAAASITLSKAGIFHFLVDSATFPRHKPCGDILTSGVLRAMNDLDPSILQELIDKKQVNPISNTHTFPPNGKPIRIDYLPLDGKENTPGCYSVSRFDYDILFLDRIAKFGFATIKQDCRISQIKEQADGIQLLTEKGETILAKLIIVATGSNNNILKQLGLSQAKSESAIGIRAHFEGVDCKINDSELYLDSSIMPGGLYITPLPAGKFNVNLVVSMDKVAAENLNLKEKFESVIQSNPVLKTKFARAKRIGNFEGSMLFLGLKQKVISGNRLMIAGDSGGLIDFFTGNGIPQAMVSGKMAAQRAIESIAAQDFSKEFLLGFENALYKKLNKNYTAEKLIFPLLHKRTFSRFVLKFLNYLSNRPHTNEMLRDLLYQKDPGKIVRNPKFLYNLLIKRVKVSPSN